MTSLSRFADERANLVLDSSAYGNAELVKTLFVNLLCCNGETDHHHPEINRSFALICRDEAKLFVHFPPLFYPSRQLIDERYNLIDLSRECDHQVLCRVRNRNYDRENRGSVSGSVSSNAMNGENDAEELMMQRALAISREEERESRPISGKRDAK